MSGGSSWLRARGQLTFLAGLVISAAVILSIERTKYVPVADIDPPSTLLRPPGDEAKRHWSYVVRNRDAQTGLTSDDEGSGRSSLAGVGYTIKATLAAHRAGLIDGQELYRRLQQVLTTLSRLSPSDAAHTISISSGRAEGASAVQTLAPLVSALELIAWSYPANSAQAAAELRRWSGVSSLNAPAASTELQRAATTLMGAAATGETR